MLLSNRHKFLFVHIAKTGGTSVRSALSRMCWSDPLHWPMFVCHRISHLCGHRIGAKFPRHAGAIAAKEMLKPSYFDSLFKFAYVRNPWDRMVSSYHHFLREQPAVLKANHVSDFHDFARWVVNDSHDYRSAKQVLVDAIRRPQMEHLVDLSGTVVVDFVGRYEQLDTDFESICRQIGIDAPDLPHKRKSSKRRDYREYYADTTAEWIARHYRADVDRLGYTFDPQTQPVTTIRLTGDEDFRANDNDQHDVTGQINILSMARIAK